MRYNVIFQGKLLPGKNIRQVRQALEPHFVFDDKTLDLFLSDQSVVVCENAELETAQRMQRLFQEAGVICVVKEQSSIGPDNHPAIDGMQTGSATEPFRCPKCGHAQRRDVECSNCGIIIERYLNLQQQHHKDNAHHDQAPWFAKLKAWVLHPTTIQNVFSFAFVWLRRHVLAMLITFGILLLLFGFSANTGQRFMSVLLAGDYVVSYDLEMWDTKCVRNTWMYDDRYRYTAFNPLDLDGHVDLDKCETLLKIAVANTGDVAQPDIVARLNPVPDAMHCEYRPV